MSEQNLSRLELQIGRLLRFGVPLMAIMLATGLALALGGVAGAAAVLNAGLVLLMVMPIGCILMSFVDSVRRRDALLIWSTVTILVMLSALLVYELMQ